MSTQIIYTEFIITRSGFNLLPSLTFLVILTVCFIQIYIYIYIIIMYFVMI
jgi:hypothetical protein